MTGAQRLQLHLHKKAVFAEELLRTRAGDLTAQGLYDAILESTGDRGAAESARAKRMLDDMRRAEGG